MTCPTHPGARDIDGARADCRAVIEIKAELACRNDGTTLAWMRGTLKSSARDMARLGNWLSGNSERLRREIQAVGARQ